MFEPSVHRTPWVCVSAFAAPPIGLVTADLVRGPAPSSSTDWAVVDLLTDTMEGRVVCHFCPVTITAGQYRVSKKELVRVLQVLRQTRRLRIAEALPEAALLTKELETFQVKITAPANETFGAWREGQRDGLVLAMALAAWAGERRLATRPPPAAPCDWGTADDRPGGGVHHPVPRPRGGSRGR